MEGAKGFADHVEEWLSWVPGVGTYRGREERRETDKKIREHIVDQLQEARSHVKRVTLEFSQKGLLDLLVDLDHLSAQIQQAADTIRYASYGFGGIFDLEKIRDEEIQRLCSFDLSLKEDIERLQGKMEEIKSDLIIGPLKKKILEAGALVVNLEEKFKKRRNFTGRRA